VRVGQFQRTHCNFKPRFSTLCRWRTHSEVPAYGHLGGFTLLVIQQVNFVRPNSMTDRESTKGRD